MNKPIYINDEKAMEKREQGKGLGGVQHAIRQRIRRPFCEGAV